MKRFLVFGCNQFYPAGGWGDFCEGFKTKKAAREYVKMQKKARTCLNYEIVDLLAEGII